MSVLPSQRLSTGEFFVSIAAGLMLFLLPNDAKNQIHDLALAEGYVFIFSVIISFSLLFGLKRYEALGTAMMSTSVLTLISVFFTIINGSIKVSGYWFSFTEYQLITMFILWTVPFFFAVCVRMLRTGAGDTNDSRMRFTRFLVLSIRALMIIYILVLVFRQVLPARPNTASERTFDFSVFNRISQCLNGTHENGLMYIFWHSLILAPLTFTLLILNQKIKLWHLMLICTTFGVTLEVLQFSFNTGSVCIDDVIMYFVGGMFGILLKFLIDFVRSVITSGQDKSMLNFSYSLVTLSDSQRTKIKGDT